MVTERTEHEPEPEVTAPSPAPAAPDPTFEESAPGTMPRIGDDDSLSVTGE